MWPYKTTVCWSGRSLLAHTEHIHVHKFTCCKRPLFGVKVVGLALLHGSFITSTVDTRDC